MIYLAVAFVVQSLILVQLFASPWTVMWQAFLSITISWSLLKLMSIESVMPSNHLFLCCRLHLLPSIFLSIRVFSSELALLIRWPKYWIFSFSISLSNEYSGWFPLGFNGLISLLLKGLSRVFSSIIVWKYPLLDIQSSLWSSSHICTWLLEKSQLWLDGPLLAKWCLYMVNYSYGKMSVTASSRKRGTLHFQIGNSNTLLPQERKEDFFLAQQQAQPIENAVAQPMRNCHLLNFYFLLNPSPTSFTLGGTQSDITIRCVHLRKCIIAPIIIKFICLLII